MPQEPDEDCENPFSMPMEPPERRDTVHPAYP